MKTIEQIFTVVISIFEYIFEFLSGLISGMPEKKKGYNAEFISSGTLLSSFNKGFCLTGSKKLSLKFSHQNVMACGGTGTGKSSVVLIPTLYATSGSFIINDPSGELYEKSSAYLQQRGYKVMTLNFANHIKSSGYNPLERANTSSDIQKVASLLIENALGGKKSDPFWNSHAISLLTMLITILKKQEPEYRNLYNVRQLLNALGGKPKSVDMLFSDYADPALFAEYKAFISYDDKVVSGVIATCKSALQIFNDEEVASVTSYDNLDFKQFRETPTALFIQNSVADQKYYSVITSLFFEQFFSYLLSRFPTKEEQDIFLLIDEASSLHLPTLPLAVANCRKHRAGILILLQSYTQLQNQYGKENANAIRSNCFTQMYFTGQSLETCKELSEILGKYQYEDEKKKTTVVRSLMTPDEIRTMKMNRALLICGHYPPIIAKLRPYYSQIKYRKYGSLPPLETLGQANLGSVPILPLNAPSDKQEEQNIQHEQEN